MSRVENKGRAFSERGRRAREGAGGAGLFVSAVKYWLLCSQLLLGVEGAGSMGVASSTELREGLQHFEAAGLP